MQAELEDKIVAKAVSISEDVGRLSIPDAVFTLAECMISGECDKHEGLRTVSVGYIMGVTSILESSSLADVKSTSDAHGVDVHLDLGCGRTIRIQVERSQSVVVVTPQANPAATEQLLKSLVSIEAMILKRPMRGMTENHKRAFSYRLDASLLTTVTCSKCATPLTVYSVAEGSMKVSCCQHVSNGPSAQNARKLAKRALAMLPSEWTDWWITHEALHIKINQSLGGNR